jgi:hypothetical protein
MEAPFSLSGRRLIAQFGGPTDLHDLANRHGFPVTVGRVRKWQERDTVSSDGLALMVVLADKTGVELDLLGAVVTAEHASIDW